MLSSFVSSLEIISHLQDLVLVILHFFEYVQGSQLAHAKESEVSDQEDEKEHDD